MTNGPINARLIIGQVQTRNNAVKVSSNSNLGYKLPKTYRQSFTFNLLTVFEQTFCEN